MAHTNTPSWHLLESPLAVLALFPHPAGVAHAGVVDAAAGEARALLAGFALGTVSEEQQVEESGPQKGNPRASWAHDGRLWPQTRGEHCHKARSNEEGGPSLEQHGGRYVKCI